MVRKVDGHNSYNIIHCAHHNIEHIEGTYKTLVKLDRLFLPSNQLIQIVYKTLFAPSRE